MSEEFVWIKGVGWGKADPEETEPPRPEPGFRVYVERNTEKANVTHAVMDVYDIAVNSMDFGSGFLSTEEVGNLRILGEAIGAKRFDYQHDKCLRCGCEKRSSCHHAPGYRPTCPPPPCSCTGFISGAYGPPQ